MFPELLHLRTHKKDTGRRLKRPAGSRHNIIIYYQVRSNAIFQCTHVTKRGGHIVAGRRVLDYHLALTDRAQLQGFFRPLDDFQFGQIQPLFQSRLEPMVVALGRQAFVVGCVQVLAVPVRSTRLELGDIKVLK